MLRKALLLLLLVFSVSAHAVDITMRWTADVAFGFNFESQFTFPVEDPEALLQIDLLLLPTNTDVTVSDGITTRVWSFEVPPPPNDVLFFIYCPGGEPQCAFRPPGAFNAAFQPRWTGPPLLTDCGGTPCSVNALVVQGQDPPAMSIVTDIGLIFNIPMIFEIVPPAGQIAVDTTVIDFGDVEVNGPPATALLPITNTGDGDLTISGVTFVPDDVGFVLAPIPMVPPPFPTFPLVIPPEESSGLLLAFLPQIPGPASAVLQIASDDPVTPIVEVDLIGNGVVLGAECLTLPATIEGDNGPNVLIGTSGDDVIVGFGGNDLIRGRGGNDTICGGAGDDTIFGNKGNDTLHGGPGDDTIVGGKDNDMVVGELGNDVLLGNGGDDTLEGNEGRDRMFGGGGMDDLNGGTEDDTLVGNGAADTLTGGDGTDTCDNDSSDTVVSCELVRQ